MVMYRLYVFCVAAVLSSVLSSEVCAQQQGGVWQQRGEREEAGRVRHERICEQKRLYLVSEMGLNEVEGKAFLVLWDEYEREAWRWRRVERRLRRGVPDGASGDWYSGAVDSICVAVSEQARLRQVLMEGLRRVFTPEQIYRFFRAEAGFNRQLVKEFDNRCRDGRN